MSLISQMCLLRYGGSCWQQRSPVKKTSWYICVIASFIYFSAQMLSESCINLPADDIVNSELNVGRGKAGARKIWSLNNNNPALQNIQGMNLCFFLSLSLPIYPFQLHINYIFYLVCNPSYQHLLSSTFSYIQSCSSHPGGWCQWVLPNLSGVSVQGINNRRKDLWQHFAGISFLFLSLLYC